MNTIYMYGPLVLIVLAIVVLAWKAWKGRTPEPSHLVEELEIEHRLRVVFTDGYVMSMNVKSPSDAQVMLNRLAFTGIESADLTENGVSVAFMNASGVLVRNPV